MLTRLDGYPEYLPAPTPEVPLARPRRSPTRAAIGHAAHVATFLNHTHHLLPGAWILANSAKDQICDILRFRFRSTTAKPLLLRIIKIGCRGFSKILAEGGDESARGIVTHVKQWLSLASGEPFQRFQLPTNSPPTMAPSAMSVRCDSPRHMTVLPGGGSLARAR